MRKPITARLAQYNIEYMHWYPVYDLVCMYDEHRTRSSPRLYSYV